MIAEHHRAHALYCVAICVRRFSAFQPWVGYICKLIEISPRMLKFHSAFCFPFSVAALSSRFLEAHNLFYFSLRYFWGFDRSPGFDRFENQSSSKRRLADKQLVKL